jgi:chromatin remodeling complex protein RSC6
MSTRGLNKLMDKIEKRNITENLNEEKKVRKSGFVKPIKVPKALCDILEISYGTEMQKSDIDTKLDKYIKSNGLEIGSKRMIKPDRKLSILLNLDENDIIDHINFKIRLKKILKE